MENDVLGFTTMLTDYSAAFAQKPQDEIYWQVLSAKIENSMRIFQQAMLVGSNEKRPVIAPNFCSGFDLIMADVVDVSGIGKTITPNQLGLNQAIANDWREILGYAVEQVFEDESQTMAEGGQVAFLTYQFGKNEVMLVRSACRSSVMAASGYSEADIADFNMRYDLTAEAV
jgi:hypothetical protein